MGMQQEISPAGAQGMSWYRSIAVQAGKFEYALRQMGRPAIIPEHLSACHNRKYLAILIHP